MRGRIRLLGIVVLATAFLLAGCASADTGNQTSWVNDAPAEDSPILETYDPGIYRIEGVAVRFLDDSPNDVNNSWVRVLHAARDIIGEELFGAALAGDGISLEVGHAPEMCVEWAFGCAGGRTIQIQEGQNVELALTIVPEPTAKDGVTYEERLKVFIHEFGHIVDDMSVNVKRSFGGAFRADIVNVPELSPTTYGQRNSVEDFAETFSHYLLVPDHLLQYHPVRYRVMQNLFGPAPEDVAFTMSPSHTQWLTYGSDGTFAPGGYLPNTYLVAGNIVTFEEDTTPVENAKRVSELLEVLTLLPLEFIDDIGGFHYLISGEPDLCSDTWASGCAWRDMKQIGVHERSDIEAYPWDWEHFAEGGYTELERIKILVHEFGHIVDFHVLNGAQHEAFEAVRARESENVTSYGATKPVEDFADSFAFYVLWPDYLAAHYPERFAYMQELFGVEYKPQNQMPSSVLDRLTHPWPITNGEEP